jgi:hypothetical protein
LPGQGAGRDRSFLNDDGQLKRDKFFSISLILCCTEERLWTANRRRLTQKKSVRHIDVLIAMHLLTSREYPVVDYQTMAEFIGLERLFRAINGAFWLYMSSDGKQEREERIIRLTARDALTWLHASPEQFGSFWDFASVTPLQQDAENGAPGP